MCNPLYDIQAEVDEETLQDLGLRKGAMFLVDGETQQAYLERVGASVVHSECGGSGANTAIGVALLGGRACYAGKVADDFHGELYTQKLRERQVGVSVRSGDGMTGICLVLITPDAERTLCTHLGISRDLGPEDVDTEAIRASRFVYVTGYLWDTDRQQAAVLHAMESARAAGVPVALNLSDPFCVQRHRDAFLHILERYCNLVIGNEEEALILTGESSAKSAASSTRRLCPRAAITLGADGSILRDGVHLFHAPGVRVDPIDTTGAGDMYAAGLLYGLSCGKSMLQSGRLGCYGAAQVVAKLGPRLDGLDVDAAHAYCGVD